MKPLDYGAYSSAMQGYTPPSAQPATNPLQSILPMALQIAGMIGGGAIGGPLGAAAGAGLGSGAGELVTGQPLNPAQMGESALFGLLPGMGGAKIASEVAGKAAADAAASDAASTVAKDATIGEAGVTPNATGNTVTPPIGNTEDTTIEGLLNKPTNLNPESNQGYVNFNKDANGNPVVDTNNTFTPPTNPQVATPAPETPGTNPIEDNIPRQVPAIGTVTSPDDTFTQAGAANQPEPSMGQKIGNGMTLDALKTQVQQGGSRLTPAQATQVAQNLMNHGYTSLADAARDANLTTGENGILSNGVNDHVNNAEVNGSSVDLHDYNQLAANNIRNGMSSGVLSPAQQKAAIQTLNETKHILGGPQATYDPTGELDLASASHVIPSNVITTVRALQGKAATQDLIAQGRGPAADGAKQVSQIYKGMANDLMERSFGGAAGNAPVSDANLENMITQVKSAPYTNPQYQQQLISTLEGAKGGNMTVQDLRHLQADHVGYANAASPNEVSNLTNGLMSAGLGKTGITNAVLNSTPGLEAKAKLGRVISKATTPSSDKAPTGVPTSKGGTNNIISGVKNMSPLAKALTIAAAAGGAGLIGNGVATANGGTQAQAILNDPNYQKTQAILNNSNELQRYLGEQGAIRSIFAPTFDPNAGEAGANGQALLTAANNNQAARTAAANLLLARARMGQSGILGGALSIIPGTSANAYAQQANNAQAQLNALGIAGGTPGAAQSGSTIPALTSMAGAVGNF